MSNEFVMVPRDLLERATKDYTGRPNWEALEPDRLKAVEELGAILDKPSEQHQGELVALPERESYTKYLPGVIPSNAAEVNARKDGWNACLDEIAKLGPLYTHADPNVRWKAVADEQMQVIEGLQRRIQNADLALKVQTQNCETLRAQLAERDALLRIYESFPGYLIDHCEGDTIYEESLQHWLANHIKSLPASPEPSAPKCETCSGHGIVGNILNAETCMDCTPSAPVERDERAAFERAFVVQEGVFFSPERKEYRSMNGRTIEETDSIDLNLRLSGWLARAALERKP